MKTKKYHQAYLGLGSNLGQKEEIIRRTIALIDEQIGTVVRQSALYYSEPWGFQSQNSFVNAVVCTSTMLTPRQLLCATQRIERLMGKTRQHATQRSTTSQATPIYQDRPIDIDILLYDDLHIDTPQLKIPHPLMQERDFVMVPLREICPTYADPEPSR